MYLRKSRADEEAEKQGEGETLAKHRRFLLSFAKEKDLHISDILEEIVSGESLIHRPMMLKALALIETGEYNGILCMDMDRLGRGSLQEQGLILETLKTYNAKIYTPRKVYDLQNEFDEEYGEFEAFMARKEFKMINRRLQGGRLRSLQRGNYIGTLPPYGYRKNNLSLEIIPKQAEIIKMIFDMYVNQRIGCGMIAEHLNKSCIESYTGKGWERSTIRNIIENPVYIGKVTWKKKIYRKPKEAGKRRETKNLRPENWIIEQGNHSAIIDEETFAQAQKIIHEKGISSVNMAKGPANPLAGLIYCKLCNSVMFYRKYTKAKAAPHIICKSKCGNKSSRFDLIEKAVLEQLKIILKQIKTDVKSKKKNTKAEMLQKSIDEMNKALEQCGKQKNKLYDLLEQGVYTTDIFLDRSNALNGKMEQIKHAIQITQNELDNEKDSAAPKINFNIIREYKKEKSIKNKNILIKSIIEKIIYYKAQDQSGEDFEIEIYTRF